MSEITYESISRKLGFRPFIDKYREDFPKSQKDDWLIDDSIPNPFSVLTDEESSFLINYLKDLNG